MSPREFPVVWVTGASRGIGAAIARSFAAAGSHVVLTGRDVGALRRIVRQIRKLGGAASFVRCDVAREKNVDAAYENICRKLKRVDVLVNNAGVTFFKSFEKTTVKDFDLLVATNLRGVFLCTKSVLPAMLKQRNGIIINIVSVSATTTFKHSSVYSATKAGVLAMSRSLRAEVRKKGVRVIDILPGAVETSMWDRRERKKYHDRMMQPEDVAEVVVSMVRQPNRVLTEEIVIRPLEGDL